MNTSGRPVDYLVIGHIAKDVTILGPTLVGTATYSSLTAQALGKRAAIVTSSGPDLDLHPLSEVSIHIVPSQDSTIFANEHLPEGRQHWTAARFAKHLAAFSVSRRGIASIPRSTEVKLVERTVIE
jgi:hypothetical protein